MSFQSGAFQSPGFQSPYIRTTASPRFGIRVNVQGITALSRTNTTPSAPQPGAAVKRKNPRYRKINYESAN